MGCDTGPSSPAIRSTAPSPIIRPGDVAVINRGVSHALYSENGVAFMEALAPVPLDHVPDRELDLVLGPDGGATHVEH